MTIGEKIYYCRLENHMTQKELGEKTGIDSATIGKYERGKLNPKFETIIKIANALNLPDPMIFYSDEEKERAWNEILQENSGMITRSDGNGNFQSELVKKDYKGKIQRIYTCDLKTDVVKKIAIHMAIDHIWGRNDAIAPALLNAILGLYPADGERPKALLDDIEKLAYNIQIKDPTQK